jgi:hypothetical protein
LTLTYVEKSTKFSGKFGNPIESFYGGLGSVLNEMFRLLLLAVSDLICFCGNGFNDWLLSPTASAGAIAGAQGSAILGVAVHLRHGPLLPTANE